jgi:hypothetical protein
MEKIGQLFRLGLWTVKPENVPEFIAAWQTSAEWLARNLPNERGGDLLENMNDSGKFISFAPISVSENVEEAMGKAEFQELMSRAMALCEDVKPNNMRVVGGVGNQNKE